MANARSRDPRLLKMRNQIGNSNMQGHSIKIVQESSSAPVVPQMSSLRGLPRIPKHNKSSASTHDREDPRKQQRRDKDSEEKSSSSSHRSKSSSSKTSPSKKSNHESSRKRDDERKSSKSSHKSSSRSHSTSSKSPSKSSEDTPKDIDLRVLAGDIDMRPDSTTAADKNKLLDQLLHNEDIRSSQDSMISTSNDNGKEQIAIKIISMRLTMYHNKFCFTQDAIIYYDDDKKITVIVKTRI